MTTQKKSDQELIDLMKGGDELAFAELVERYSQKVHNLAMRLTRSEEDTEEVLQDVFVTIYRKIASFEAKSAFSSWLYRITVNTAFMKLRRNRRQNLISFDECETHLEDKIHSNGNSTSQLTSIGSQDELRQTLQRAVNKLPYEYKLIFILRDVDGLSNQAVSEIMQLSVAAIKSRLH
ncbi:MAG: sigma-70 family RNA polymerase sigma factor, partial [SAR324 cluster bacterium]|nr:sigma-70 family RNA polymerase sigma factor [SAR324 cluster bacterium]